MSTFVCMCYVVTLRDGGGSCEVVCVVCARDCDTVNEVLVLSSLLLLLLLSLLLLC